MSKPNNVPWEDPPPGWADPQTSLPILIDLLSASIRQGYPHAPDRSKARQILNRIRALEGRLPTISAEIRKEIGWAFAFGMEYMRSLMANSQDLIRGKEALKAVRKPRKRNRHERLDLRDFWMAKTGGKRVALGQLWFWNGEAAKVGKPHIHAKHKKRFEAWVRCQNWAPKICLT